MNCLVFYKKCKQLLPITHSIMFHTFKIGLYKNSPRVIHPQKDENPPKKQNHPKQFTIFDFCIFRGKTLLIYICQKTRFLEPRAMWRIIFWWLFITVYLISKILCIFFKSWFEKNFKKIHWFFGLLNYFQIFII